MSTPASQAAVAPPRGRRVPWLIILLLLVLAGVGVWRAANHYGLRIHNPFDPVERTRVAIELLGGIVKTKTGPDGRLLHYVTLDSRYHGGDEGLVHLADLPALDGVYIENGTITDAGVATLGRLEQLDELSLTCPSVTDAGVRSLAGLRKVRWLSLSGVPVTDASLITLEQLGTLEKLTLTGGRITDAGLPHLLPLKELRRLWLDFTLVTDEGVEHLEKLEKLERLWVDGSKVTPAGAKRLQASRAELEVVYSAPSRWTN